MEKYLILVPIALLASIGGTLLIAKLAKFSYELEKEAKDHNKKIEYGLFVVSLLAFFIAIGGLIFTIYSNYQASVRIENLKVEVELLKK